MGGKGILSDLHVEIHVDVGISHLVSDFCADDVAFCLGVAKCGGEYTVDEGFHALGHVEVVPIADMFLSRSASVSNQISL